MPVEPSKCCNIELCKDYLGRKPVKDKQCWQTSGFVRPIYDALVQVAIEQAQAIRKQFLICSDMATAFNSSKRGECKNADSRQ